MVQPGFLEQVGWIFNGLITVCSICMSIAAPPLFKFRHVAGTTTSPKKTNTLHIGLQETA